MFPHLSVHGRRDQNLRASGERDRGERMSGESVREFRNYVRRCRSDQQKVRAIREIDVSRPPAFFLVEETGGHRIFRKRLKRERRDELSRVASHHDKNVVALFNKEARQLGGFVGGDGTGHTEDDSFHFRRGAHADGKLQAPSPKHQRSSKSQAPKIAAQLDGCLELEDSLELGAWCLEVFFTTASTSGSDIFQRP